MLTFVEDKTRYYITTLFINNLNNNIMENFNAVNLVIMFGFNFNQNFISEVWSGSLATHLQSKFYNCYTIHGANGAFYTFYTQLDEGNRKLLVNYILANYKG